MYSIIIIFCAFLAYNEINRARVRARTTSTSTSRARVHAWANIVEKWDRIAHQSIYYKHLHSAPVNRLVFYSASSGPWFSWIDIFSTFFCFRHIFHIFMSIDCIDCWVVHSHYEWIHYWIEWKPKNKLAIRWCLGMEIRKLFLLFFQHSAAKNRSFLSFCL